MDWDKYPSDWNQRRKTLFKQYEWKCQHCGAVIPAESDCELHAHHVQPISEGGGHELENLIPLCRRCHQEIHLSEMETDLHPGRWFDCANCDISYPEGTGAKGSFCSMPCYLSHLAEKQLNRLHQDTTICSTCFSSFPRSADVCPNCDSWDANEDRREALDADTLDVKNLIQEIVREYEYR